MWVNKMDRKTTHPRALVAPLSPPQEHDWPQRPYATGSAVTTTTTGVPARSTTRRAGAYVPASDIGLREGRVRHCSEIARQQQSKQEG